MNYYDSITLFSYAFLGGVKETKKPAWEGGRGICYLQKNDNNFLCPMLSDFNNYPIFKINVQYIRINIE